MKNRIQDKGFKLKSGEFKAYRCGNVLVTAWRPERKNKIIYMISTEANSRVITISKKNPSAPVIKPEVIDIYNQTMNGVDLADQLTVSYGFVRKSCKVFFGLFEVTIINSYILYKTTDPRITHVQFRRALVDQLTRDYIQQSVRRPLAGRPRSSLENQPERLDSRKHFLAKSLNVQWSVTTPHFIASLSIQSLITLD